VERQRARTEPAAHNGERRPGARAFLLPEKRIEARNSRRTPSRAVNGLQRRQGRREDALEPRASGTGASKRCCQLFDNRRPGQNAVHRLEDEPVLPPRPRTAKRSKTRSSPRPRSKSAPARQGRPRDEKGEYHAPHEPEAFSPEVGAAVPRLTTTRNTVQFEKLGQGSRHGSHPPRGLGSGCVVTEKRHLHTSTRASCCARSKRSKKEFEGPLHIVDVGCGGRAASLIALGPAALPSPAAGLTLSGVPRRSAARRGIPSRESRGAHRHLGGRFFLAPPPRRLTSGHVAYAIESFRARTGRRRAFFHFHGRGGVRPRWAAPRLRRLP